MALKKQQAYENLRYRIISQQLSPGELLKDKELMDHYGIGRTPLREIMLELQTEGLIKRVPRAGTWVAPMDFNFLRQITEIRIGLEGLAGELAAERISQNQITEMEKVLKKAADLESHEKINIEKLIKYESEFHGLLYQATGNEKLEKLLKNYQSIGARFWHYLVFSRDELAGQFKSHRIMMESIKKRDKRTCKEIMENHIRKYIGIIDERMSRTGIN